jgi:hypothetical protein
MIKNSIIKSIAFLILLVAIMYPVSAEINITPSDITTTSIMWTWEPITIQNISIDGKLIDNFNPSATSFILSDLKPGEPHTIDIVTSTDTGTNITKTLINPPSNQEDFYQILKTWVYLLFVLAFCIAGMQRRLGVFLIVASVISLYALYIFITSNIPGTDPLIEIPFYVYIFFFLFPHYMAFRKGGYTK